MTRSRVRAKPLLDQLASVPLVFPGIVLGIAVLGLYIRSPIPVYGTIWILVLAYVIGYLPYGLRYVHPGLLRIHADLEESARVSGAGWYGTFVRVVLPLLRPALVAGWTFVFLISVRELAIAALLWTPRTPVIATTMLDLWTNGNTNQVAAFGAIVAVLSMGAAAALARIGSRWGVQG
jgi:iron(III) transport system permease protein